MGRLFDTQTAGVETSAPKGRLFTEPITEKQPTTLGKVAKAGGELVKSVVSPVVTLAARPVQLGAMLAGKTEEEINKFDLGGLIAPIPRTKEDLIKDVGRGIQTVALGLPTTALASKASTALKAGKLAGQSLTFAGEGALFGAGAGMEQTGRLFDKEVARQAALGTALGAGLPIAGAGASKLLGKTSTKEAQKIGEKIVYSGQPAGEVVSGGTKFYTPNKTVANKYAKLNEGVTGTSEVVQKDISGLNFKKVAQSELLDALEDPKIRSQFDGIEYTVKGEKQPSYAVFEKEAPKVVPKAKLSKTEKLNKSFDDLLPENTDPVYKETTVKDWVSKAEALVKNNKVDDILDTIFLDKGKVALPEGLPKEAVRKYLQSVPEKLTTKQKIRISNSLKASEAGAELRATQIYTDDAFDKVGEVNRRLQNQVKSMGYSKQSIINFLDDNICPM